MKFKAVIMVTFKKSILDPQATAVHKALQAQGHTNVEEVRVGKHIEVLLESESREVAQEQLGDMSEKLLSNPVIEDYHIEILEV